MSQIDKCRMCESKNIELFLDLGFTPLADNFLTCEQLSKSETHYPLQVYLCKNCGFIQLGYIVPPEKMYHSDYPYESSTTKTGSEHFHKMAEEICQKFNLKEKSIVVDIGSNVGVLLQGFKNQKMTTVGIEPSKNIAKIAIENGIETISDFFNEDSINEITSKYDHASIVTATNVFAHIGDLNEFMKNIEKVLTDKGIFIFEAPYFVNLLENMEYDTIYHEHLGYISIKPLVSFFKKFGMELFDVQQTNIHGGSIRGFIGKKNQHKISAKIKEMIKVEENKEIYSITKLKEFASRVHIHKKELINLLYNIKNEGKRIVCISAPAKGMTLLNFCNIDNVVCDYVTEKSKLKIGKYTPGVHLRVKPDEFLIEDKPDYALVLAWNFADEIIHNNKEFRNNGGKFIIPIPNLVIV
jgi:SAM-dependent methyltransferase